MLALDYADRSALGALGSDIEHAFSLAKPRFALLATAFTGAAVSFLMLVGSRIVLGAIAAARPAIASITGDAFRRTAQARVLSVIDAGELVITRAYGIGRSAAGVSLLAVGLVGCG